MSQLIQSLEGRTLFAAAFGAEQAQVLADAAAARAALTAAAKTVSTDIKTLTADLRPLTTAANRATNLALLKALKADVAVSVKTLRLDARNLLSKSTALSRRVAATGNALTLRPGNVKLMDKLAADLPALVLTTAASMAQLSADMAAMDIEPELTALTAANPTGTVLAGHAVSTLVNAGAALVAFGTAATTFQADVAILAARVDALPDTPSLVGTWAGGADETFGPEAGLHITLVAKFTSQGIDGSLAGTVRGTPTGGTTITMTLVGTIAEDGTFTATATPTGSLQSTTTLTGTLSGNTLSGTYTTDQGGGTFTLTRT
jgi:hypothetical protein